MAQFDTEPFDTEDQLQDGEGDQKKPKSVQELVASLRDVKSGKQDAPPSSESVYKIISEMEKIKQTAPEEDKTNWDQKIADAKQMYQERANRNDWLEVAQTLGQALARAGAAASGMQTGRDMSNLSLPSIDYGARTGRASQEYQTELGNIESQRRAARQEQADKLARGETDYKQQLAPYHELSKFEEERYKLGQEAEMKKAAEKAQAGRETTRQAQADTKDEARRLEDAIRDQRKKIQAAASLANSYQNYDELDKKSKELIDRSFGELAGKADIETGKLADIQSRAKKPTLFGLMESDDPTKKAELLNSEIVEPLRKSLKELEDRRASLSKPQAAAPAPSKSKPAPTKSTGPKPGDVENGYKFLGGNPADPKSWEKAE